MSLTYKIEDIIDEKDALNEIGEEGWNEVDQLNSVTKWDMDWEQYSALNNAGMIRYYTVYDGETLVGFSIFFITQCLHSKDFCVSSCDLLFLKKGYRGNGREFLAFIQADLKEQGAQWFSLNVKTGFNTEKLEKAIGCTHYENVLQGSL